MNSCKNPNAQIVKTTYDIYKQLAVFALKVIHIGEEIRINYHDAMKKLGIEVDSDDTPNKTNATTNTNKKTETIKRILTNKVK